MFGLFKKKTDDNEIRLKSEFEALVRQIKSSELEKQGVVGRGIQAAEESFRKKYTTASFQAATFAEQMKQIEFNRNMEVEINKMDGPIRIMAIGYALFNKWLAAVMSSNSDLMHQFEGELRNFKEIADSFGDGGDQI